MSLPERIVVGIDAANLRAGGGLTHVVEVLDALDAERAGVERVVIWAGGPTLDAIADRRWLVKRRPRALDGNLIARSAWQRLGLARAARRERCEVLFVPGGSYAGGYHPVVTMSRNMLPFENRELARYGASSTTLRLAALRLTQSRSFMSADGIIFLTRYAQRSVIAAIGPLRGESTIIPHGAHARFKLPPRPQRGLETYTVEAPYRLLYVSIVDVYKHQWHVVEAVSALRREGLPLSLDLVGPAYPPALERLQRVLRRFDPEREWAQYHGPVPHTGLGAMYASADLGIFASSCENMPNILLENMAAGLPIACAERGPMPEVLGEAGAYFDPERPADIARAVRELVTSPALRTEKAAASYAAAQQFTWARCAADTFAFLGRVARRYRTG